MKLNSQFFLVLATLVAVIALRLVPHLPNFSPLCAIALFGAAHFRNRWLAYTLPLVAIVISDVLVNNILYAQYFNGFTLFYEGCWWQYAAYAVIVLGATAWFQRGISAVTVLGGAFGASLIFFLLSNFGVWAGSAMYPQNAAGLMACYAAGLPFLQTTLASDVLFSGVLFGVFALVERLSQRLAVVRA
jgi:hypothetical protein